MSKPIGRLKLVTPEQAPKRVRRRSPDPETRRLVAALREADRLRAEIAAHTPELREALRAWSDRPGQRGGVASEAGARYLLRQAGLLK